MSLFGWYFNGDTDIVEGGPFKVSEVSAGYVRPMWESIGSMVIGRHLFDLTNGWEGRPPTGHHVVVISHRPKPDGWHPEASFRTRFVAEASSGGARSPRVLASSLVVTLPIGAVGPFPAWPVWVVAVASSLGYAFSQSWMRRKG